MKLPNKNLFTLLSQTLIIILPFYVLVKVFFEFQLGIGYFGILAKEGLLIILGLSVVYEFWKAKKIPKFELLDYLIFAYFGYGIIITLVNNLGINFLFHGGRYDFMFLGVFLIFRHGQQFLQISTQRLMQLFVWSGAISLLLGFTLKVIGEEFLTLFGYNYYVSNWTFSGSVPIYHGVEGSGLRRFQGILDGPNQMAFFLFTYLGAALYFTKKRFEFHHGLIFIFIFSCILMTYSRSALLGLLSGMSLLLLFNIKTLFSKYKKQMIALGVIMLLIAGSLATVFQRKIESIIIRPGSTSAHLERMMIGIDLFIEKPLGHGLATSGPGYRQTHPGIITKEDEKKFIPESWFIQQLVEGGVIYFTLFCSILLIILYRIYFISPSFFVACVGIGVMNVFLHTFEATYISALLFALLGILISQKYA